MRMRRPASSEAVLATFERDGMGVFLPLGRSALLARLGGGDRARRELARLLREGSLRAAASRVYYPPERRESRFFGTLDATPDAAAVGRAFAAERGWQSTIGQSAAENAIGLSTQVPARALVAADGCPGRLRIYGGATLIEPAPSWIFAFGEVARLLIQGTRHWERDGAFSFPPSTDWDEDGMTVEEVARDIARRARPAFAKGLRADVDRLPPPYADLAAAILDLTAAPPAPAP